MLQADDASDAWNDPALVWVDRHNWRPETAFADVQRLDDIDASRLEQPGRFIMASHDALDRLTRGMLARPGLFELAHRPDLAIDPSKLLFFADRLRRHALATNQKSNFSYDAAWLGDLSSMDYLDTKYSHLLLRCCNETHPAASRQQWLIRTLRRIELLALRIKMTAINSMCDIFRERSVQDARSQAVIGLWLAQIISRGEVDCAEVDAIFTHVFPDKSMHARTPKRLIEDHCPEAFEKWALIESLDLNLNEAHDLVWMPASAEIQVLPVSLGCQA